MTSMYEPLALSMSGKYVAGMVAVPRGVEAATRPALWTPGGRVGHEDDFDLDSEERAWVAVQLDKSNRYRELIASLANQGKLTLRPGHPGFGADVPGIAMTPSGIYAPVTSWALDALHYRRAIELLENDKGVVIPNALWTRLDGAGSVAELVRLLESHARLPQRIWDALDELVGQEKGRTN